MNVRVGIMSLMLVASGGCGSEGPEVVPETEQQLDPTGEEVADEPETVGSCLYTSPFTNAQECRDYVGEAWEEADIRTDCEQQRGTLMATCETEGSLGRCILNEGDELYEVVAYGDDPGECAGQQFGCETFGGGLWEPESMCGDNPDAPPTPPQGNVFIQPTLECVDALPGEEPGNGPDGQVCTWQIISASTEEGRRFSDYASCDIVYSQRPYYPVPPASESDVDPRMDDPVYAGELAWVKEQIEASACVCCHSDEAPNGASNWTIDAPGNWMNTFRDQGLAMAAGWINSDSFGAYDPADNNGFDRSEVGIPSTDPERMKAFFVAELGYRGASVEDYAGEPPFGGPLYTQLVYEPGPCEAGEGVREDGTLVWEGGDARYVYVLEVGSQNPTVPPNLDLPEGTIWRADVASDKSAVANESLRYGELQDGMSQRFPAENGPADLVKGKDYYLYVLRDVAVPLTRCEFTYPVN